MGRPLPTAVVYSIRGQALSTVFSDFILHAIRPNAKSMVATVGDACHCSLPGRHLFSCSRTLTRLRHICRPVSASSRTTYPDRSPTTR